MIGVLTALLGTWFLLRYVVHEPISVLGLAPTRRRGKEFTVGLLFMAALAVINFLWQADFKEISYQRNPDYGLLEALTGSYWILRGVLFEEFVFRGALLYLLIKRLGIVRACLISSLVFGVYHWYSYEVVGERLVLMAYILLVTGAGGWMFAFAYAKTRSLYAPTGLHLGWNLVTAVVFSSGPLGDQWLIPQGEPVETGDWGTLLFFSLQAIVAPGLATWFLVRVRPEAEAADPAESER